MILIIAEEKDISALKVCEWLDAFNADFHKVNDLKRNMLSHLILTNSNDEIRISDSQIDKLNIAERNTVWYRRGHIRVDYKIESNFIPPFYNQKIKEHLQRESLEVRNYISYYHSEYAVDTPRTYRINKLVTLYEARNVGLKIPKTFICDKKEELLRIMDQFGLCKVLCKPLSENVVFKYKNFSQSNTRKILSKEDVEAMSESFGYSMFQEFLVYKIEVRVFIFDDIISAIGKVRTDFTDKNEMGKSLVDSEKKISRIVPFKLPQVIKSKLKKLMEKINLTTGSFDLIYSTDNEFKLLEVNPIGQFDYVSTFGNVNIEKEIAKKLIYYEEERKKNIA